MWLDITREAGSDEWKFGDDSTVPDLAEYPLPDGIESSDQFLYLDVGNTPELRAGDNNTLCWPLCEKVLVEE